MLRLALTSSSTSSLRRLVPAVLLVLSPSLGLASSVAGSLRASQRVESVPGQVLVELRPVRGDLRKPRWLSAGWGPIDHADYSQAGRLVAPGPILLGPSPGGPVAVPAGEYALGLRVASDGSPPGLELRSTEGWSLFLDLAAASRPDQAPTRLELESWGGDDAVGSWPVVFHSPTSSGMLVIAGTTVEAGPIRRVQDRPRMSRGRRLRQEMDRRALEAGRPARRHRR
ncbi:MAG: hypothetical protein AAF533_02805 [Acidobacteriota bacterium]